MFLCVEGRVAKSQIEAAFGSHPKALGIIIVKDLPASYATRRENLLRLAYKFASLPESTKDKYVDPKSRYSFGWSHGKVSRISCSRSKRYLFTIRIPSRRS